MKAELLLTMGAVYHLFFALFDMSWSRLFKWEETLSGLDDTNRSLLKISNKLIVALYLFIAYISFFHTEELVSGPLGRVMLAGIALYWLARLAMQPVYFGLKEKASIVFSVLFVAGIALYAMPLFMRVG